MNELMVQEYKSLRREISQLYGSITRWQMTGYIGGGLAFLLTSAAAIAGYWVAAQAALAGLVLLAGCIFGLMRDIRSMMRVTAYVQAAHEGRDTGAMWETRQDLLQRPGSFNILRPYMTPVISILWLGLILAVVPFLAQLLSLMTNTVTMMTRGDIYAYPGQKLLWLLWSVVPPVLWLIFWGMVKPSYNVVHSGDLKREMLSTVFDSLRQP